MKKMFVKCAIICAAVLILCMGAQAADQTVTVKSVDETVKVEKVMSGEDVTFSVSKDGTTAGQLYLILIQEGEDVNAPATPTKENIYYANVEQAGASLSADAYPRDLKNGTYVVYLSDYSESNNGAAKGVATIEVKEVTSDNPSDNPDNPTLKLGDVNNDGVIDGSDALFALRIFAGLDHGGKEWTQEEKVAANVNKDYQDGNDLVDGSDALMMLQHFAGLLDDNFQRKN